MSNTTPNNIPYHAKQLNKQVKLNLDLGLQGRFQTTHIEIGEEYAYTILARFEGEATVSSFTITRIDFKLIPIFGINEGIYIDSVTFSTEEEGIRKFNLFFKEFEQLDGETDEEFTARTRNHTCLYQDPTILERSDIFDIHIDDDFYDLANIDRFIKGRQCNSYIMF